MPPVGVCWADLNLGVIMVARLKADDERGDLWRLLRAIATGADADVSELLTGAPELALAAEQGGASRSTSATYFLEEVAHYVYAGDTALHIAAAAYRTDIAKMLMSVGADASARNRRGAEPLHYACDGQPASGRWAPSEQAAVITYLLGAGADADVPDKTGTTPLHRAVRTRCASAVRVLLEHGADPRRANGSGSTPLHLAVQNTGRGGSGTDAAVEQQREVIRLLMHHGARPSDVDGAGKTVQARVAGRTIADAFSAR